MKLKSMISVLIPLLAVSNQFSTIHDVYAEDTETSIVSADFSGGNVGSWVSFGGAKVVTDIENGHSDDISLKVVDRERAYQGPSLICTTDFIPGESYDFEAWVYHESGNTETITWTLLYTDSFATESFARIAAAEVPSGEWTKISDSFVIPEESEKMQFYFECDNEAMDFNVDDVLITGTPADNDVKEDNYIKDSVLYDFESGIDGWGGRGNLRVLRTDEISHLGKNSIYATNRDRTWNGPTVNIDSLVRRGEEYFYSAYVMYNGQEYEDSHIFRIEVEFTNNGENNYELIKSQEIKKNKWENISGYFTLPESAENVSFYVQTDNIDDDQEPSLNDLMSFYVDTVKITEGSIMRKEEKISLIKEAAVCALALLILTLLIFAAVRKTRKNQIAMKLASYDAMTKMFNRNAYEKRIAELEADSEKCKNLHFSLCDVNFLKYLNDNHGHESGDEAIIRCGELLSRAVGKDGEVYRIGGDEFFCISSKEIRDSIVREIKAESENDKGYPFSVACGFAEYDEKNYSDIKSIIAECDKTMYENKKKIKSENPNYSRK